MQTFNTMVGGRPLKVELGKFAKQANGAAMIYYGDTTVLVAVTSSKEPREGVDFFPLTVDYEEKQYAAGKIPGGFIKRESRPTEYATLSARQVDRPMRPLFPKGFRNDVQIVTTVMSVDKDNSPDVTAVIGASIALNISDIPFKEPVGAVSVGMVDGQFVINPTVEQMEKTRMHITIAGTKGAIMMVEGSCDEVPEDIMLDAIFFAHEEIKRIVEWQEGFVSQVAKPKMVVPLKLTDPDMEAAIKSYAAAPMLDALQWPEKLEREERVAQVFTEAKAHFTAIYPDQDKAVNSILESVEKETVRRLILDDGKRVDGRALKEIRTVTCEVGILPRAHGSALFTRGQTQVLSVATLGAVSDNQMLDGLGIETSKTYIHHYNFPPYSVGETGRMRGPGRREIGHGALAERALLAVLPSEADFPYTVRVVSEVLESNGSSSMGSVCGSSMALMHAGAPIKSPVAGIAMGLVKNEDRYAILSDIQGIEDALGDMDFKVAGTATGVTAVQMDIKIAGVSREIMSNALAQAREGRLFIMSKMAEAITQANTEMSPFAPRMITLMIHPDKIREIIGPGGKMIHKIVDATGAKIDIEDDGRVFIMASDQASAEKARFYVDSIVKEVEVGKVYNGRVTRIMDFGAFVEIIPGIFGASGKEGLCHISQLDETRVGKVTDVVNVGDAITVKVTEIDHQGRINLSRKEVLRQLKNAADPNQERVSEEARSPHPDRPRD